MRKPPFSRQTGTTPDDESPTLVDGTRTDASAVPMRMRHDDPTVPDPDRTESFGATPPPAHRADADEPTRHMVTDRTVTERTVTDRDSTDRDTTDRNLTGRTDTGSTAVGRADERADADRTPVVAGPKPRASLLATLGLITGVASALLVLSGPLVGYGIALAVLAFLLSIGGMRATRRRHVAGKSDALIGMVVALGAIVVGVLALTGSLSWLGTDTDPVSRLRDWLDAQTVDRF